MKSILEELWYGNIHPQEDDPYNTSKLKKLSKNTTSHFEKLDETLSDEQKELLEQLMSSYLDFNSLSESVIFTCGFRLGARIMLEVMSGAES